MWLLFVASEIAWAYWARRIGGGNRLAGRAANVNEAIMRDLLTKGITAFIDQLSALLVLRRWQKRSVVILIDAALCAISVWLAFSLRLGVWYMLSYGMLVTVAVALAMWLPIFLRNRTYQAIFRYSGSGTMVQLAVSCLTMMVPMVLIFMVVSVPGVPRTVAVLQPVIFLLLLALSRVIMRYVLVDLVSQHRYAGNQRRILIYGAGRAGQQLANSIRHEPGMALLGYVDDDTRLNGQRLDRVAVYGVDRLGRMINNFDVTDVYIALPNIGRARRKAIVESLEEYHVRVQILPAMRELVDGKVSVEVLREVQVTDLLGREPVSPNLLLLSRTIRDRTVVVTGAGGSIGSELCRQIVRLGPRKLILAEVGEFALFSIEDELRRMADAETLSVDIVPDLINVADEAQIDRAMDRWLPDTVFHAAAYKHVPLVEANALAGIRNNILGTLYTATAAERVGAKNFTLISTDKAVRPTNIMGATKRVCEQILQAKSAVGSKTVFTMVRFGNVLGSSGSVVPRFQRQIGEGGPVTVTDLRITRYFMSIPEAAQLVIQAGAMAEGGEVHVLDMGSAIRIADLARTMINLSGMSVRDSENPDGDIAIIEVGLRPGEKLYEELLIGNEPLPTRHDRIFRAREEMPPQELLVQAMKDLAETLQDGDAEAATAILRQLVPEYLPADAVHGECQASRHYKLCS